MLTGQFYQPGQSWKAPCYQPQGTSSILMRGALPPRTASISACASAARLEGQGAMEYPCLQTSHAIQADAVPRESETTHQTDFLIKVGAHHNRPAQCLIFSIKRPKARCIIAGCDCSSFTSSAIANSLTMKLPLAASFLGQKLYYHRNKPPCRTSILSLCRLSYMSILAPPAAPGGCRNPACARARPR